MYMYRIEEESPSGLFFLRFLRNGQMIFGTEYSVMATRYPVCIRNMMAYRL